jgi:putative salt-induced outer membrane protein YdiY
MKGFTALLAAALIGAWAIRTADAGPWTASASLGAGITRGNSENTTLNPEVKAQAKWTHDELLLRVAYAYAEDGDGVTERNGKALSQYNRILGDRAFAYLNAEAGFDSMADVNYRVLAGPGGGYYVFKRADLNLSFEAGAVWIADEVHATLADGTAEDRNDDRWACRVAQKFDARLAESTKVWESVEYLPQVDDFDVYLLNAEAGVETVLSKSLSLRTTVQYRYNSAPAPDKEKEDTALRAALVYTFAK